MRAPSWRANSGVSSVDPVSIATTSSTLPAREAMHSLMCIFSFRTMRRAVTEGSGIDLSVCPGASGEALGSGLHIPGVEDVSDVAVSLDIKRLQGGQLVVTLLQLLEDGLPDGC